MIRWIGVLAAVFWAGVTWGGPQPPPADVTFEPALVPPWLVHVRGGALYIQTAESADPQKLSEPGEGAVILSLAAALNGRAAIVAWIEKGAAGGRLRVALVPPNGPPSPPTELAAGIPSTLVAVLADGQGGAYILDAATGDNTALHLTAWNGPGAPPRRVKLDTADVPSINLLSAVVTPERLAVFVASRGEGSTAIRCLTYRLPSADRESVENVASADSVVFLKSVSFAGGPALVYKHQYGGVLGLSVAVRNETGYAALTIPETQGIDVARTAEGTWADGRVLIVLGGEDGDGGKQRIYVAASPDRGGHWDLRQIATPDGTATRARLPDLKVADHKVAAVWEDARNIRAEVRMQLSSDRGRSWLARDVRVSDGRHYATRPRIEAHDGRLYIGWYQYRTDARKEADAVLISLTWEEALALAGRGDTPVTAEEKERLLREAVAEYWDAMIRSDLQRVYERHDPFYRARVPYDGFAANRGGFVYHSHEIRGIQIDGSVARVQSSTNFEIPKILIMGKEHSVPRRDFAIDDTWIFVDGGWYRQYIDGLSGGSAVNY